MKIEIEDKFSMNVSFVLKSLARLGCDRSQIWLCTTINGLRVRIFTKLLIEPNLWQKKSKDGVNEMAREDASIGRVKLKECKAINARLKAIIGFCNEYAALVTHGSLTDNVREHNADTFKRFMDARIMGEKEKERNIDAETYIRELIDKKATMLNKDTKRKLCSGTIYNHRNALNRLLSFCKFKHVKLSWNLFNGKFETAFTAWLCDKDYSANTIACQYSIMKVWLKEAEADGYTIAKTFHNYPTKVYNVENIYLTEDEIRRIYEIDFTSDEVLAQVGYNIQQGSKIEETRDLFVVACWTGLRFGDWKDFNAVADIGDEFITVHTHKTNKDVLIPIHPHVKAILKKYGGVLPKAVDKCHTLKQIRQCGMLAGIDEPTSLCRVKGGKSVISKGAKYEFIMNHTARRSFATNMFLKGVPSISIMSITGHTSEENFMKYIKVDKTEHARIVAKAFGL